MLPAMAQDWAETTGALWSSRTMMVRPLSRVVVVTPGGMEAMSPFESGLLIRLKYERSRYSEMGGGQMQFERGRRNAEKGDLNIQQPISNEAEGGAVGEHRTLNSERRTSKGGRM